MKAEVEIGSRAFSVAGPGRGLFGRKAEIALLEKFVDRVPERGGALVIRGEPGIGKTSLLAFAERRARAGGIRVLTAGGVQSEMDLAFSGLHQLLFPILESLERLPTSQANALAAAFGLIDMPIPDPYLIARATLSLLTEAAELRPMLLLCDDAQWLDQPTADALAFVARRVQHEPIALLVAMRDGHPGRLASVDIPDLHPPRLDDAASQQLLEEHRAGLSPRSRVRIMRIAQGNPLALIELPDESSSASRRHPDFVAEVSLTARLERAFASRQAELPADTRALLLIAAAADDAVPSELLSAAGYMLGSEIDASAFAPAQAAGLAAVGRLRFSFRHPLIRSAIYQSASATQRAAAHNALATVLSGEPDRRTWHRAAAAAGADQQVAAELEALASRLARRGAVSIAASALGRAAELSCTTHDRVERLLRAAELWFESGDANAVERLVQAAEESHLNPKQRSRITWLREIFTDGIPGNPTPVLSLAAAAEQCSAEGDVELALKLLLGAGLRTWWKDPGEFARERVAALADRLQVSEKDPRLIAIIAVSAPLNRGSWVVERLTELDRSNFDDPQDAYLAGMAAHAVGHYELAAKFLQVAIEGLRAQGRLAALCQVLTMSAWDHILVGDWIAADAFAEEGRQLANETGQPIWFAGAAIAQALLVGARGDLDKAEHLIAEAEATTMPRGLSALQCVAELARGVTALGAGHHADAFDHLRRMFDPCDAAYHHADRFMGISYLADAAAHGCQRDMAIVLLKELETLKDVTCSPALRSGIAYARPILADDVDAEGHYQIALNELAAWPMMCARLQLSYGAWLRRQRRIAESRAPLRAARATFDALGARGWAERAEQELVASGQAGAERTPNSSDHLTPQELQIAKMAAAGQSNREIAQELYLSPRTVATHLYRAFPKLAITSRSQLRAALSVARVSARRPTPAPRASSNPAFQ